MVLIPANSRGISESRSGDSVTGQEGQTPCFERDTNCWGSGWREVCMGFSRQPQHQCESGWTGGTLAQKEQRGVLGEEKCQELCALEHPDITSMHVPIPASLSAVRYWGGRKSSYHVCRLSAYYLWEDTGCLPSLPGHSTLKEPKTRKVLTNPAAKRWKEWQTLGHLSPQDGTSTGPSVSLVSLDRQLRTGPWRPPGDTRGHQALRSPAGSVKRLSPHSCSVTP